MTEQKRSQLQTCFVVILCVIVFVLGAYVRVRKISSAPGWFRDEGTYFEVTRNIMYGEWRLGAVNVTFVGPYMTHPPLFFYLEAAWVSLLRNELRFFRLFCAGLGLATLLGIFFLCWRFLSRWHALLAGALFALNPQIVMFNRMGLPYNLYMFLGLLVLYCMLEYAERKNIPWLLLSVFFAALALVTAYYAVVLVVFAIVMVLATGKKIHLPWVALILIPLGIFFLVASRTPGFADDLAGLRHDAASGSPIETLRHYLEFFRSGPFYVMGVIGLCLLRRPLLRYTLLFLLLLMLHIVLRRADTMISFVTYPVIPVLPLLAIGEANLCMRFIDAARNSIASELPQRFISRIFPAPPEAWVKRVVTALIVLGVIGFLWIEFSDTRRSIYVRFDTPLQFGMVQNTGDAYRTAEFINTHASSDDLVLSTYSLWWLLKTRNANIPQALLKKGIHTDFYLSRLSPDRFLFDPSLEKARFVVEDSFTDQRMGSLPETPHYAIRTAIEYVRSKWKKVFEAGEYRVYENPFLRGAD
jgi:hypothetical protein